jgi:hypothetical protein
VILTLGVSVENHNTNVFLEKGRDLVVQSVLWHKETSTDNTFLKCGRACYYIW